MEKCSRTGVDIHDTDFGYTLSVIGGKYKMIILYWIAEYQVVRYNELRRKIGNISDKTLSKTLKELEQDQLIIRNEYPQIPPKVECERMYYCCCKNLQRCSDLSKCYTWFKYEIQ